MREQIQQSLIVKAVPSLFQNTCPTVISSLLILLTGCASVSVSNIHPKGSAPHQLPAKIFVQEFTAANESFRVDRSNQELASFINDQRHALALELVQQLSKYIAPAEILTKEGKAPRGNYWLVSGDYARVNQGSRLLRAGVGFGAGGTKMETRVQFSNLSNRKPQIFLTLLTTGGSGLTPGAWAAITPAGAFYWPGAIANAGGGVIGGLSTDRKRTAREITAALSDYSFHHQLIPEQRVRYPKKLGQLPALQRPDFVVPDKSP